MQVHWLIVPRHPQRFEVVAKLIEAQGFAVQRRSAWPESGPLISAPSAVSGGSGFVSLPIIKPTIWLGDSLGEMALYYGLADVALLGGSFAPLGGQNLIEAAACACPVVMGPHTFNFAEAAEQAMAAGAAQRVTGMAQAVEFAHALAVNPTRLQIAKSASSDFAQAHRGAAQQLAKALVQLLAATGTART
jgi:3-deoxy-D-manno-octulosonic-acid transferase